MAGLMSDMQRREILDTIMERVKTGGQQQQAISPQFMAQSTPMMQTSAPSSAAESQAFNERNKNRALYGDRWNTNGGIGRKGLKQNEIESQKALGEYTANRQAKSWEHRADKEFELGKMQLDKPQFDYKPIHNELGQIAGYQTFKDGELYKGKELIKPDLTWAKGLKSDGFGHGADRINRETANMEPGARQAYLDHLYDNNPELLRYLSEQEQQKKQKLGQLPDIGKPFSPKNPAMRGSIDPALRELIDPKLFSNAKPVQPVQPPSNKTFGDALTDTSAIKKMGSQFLKNLDAPNRLYRELSNTKLPLWLR